MSIGIGETLRGAREEQGRAIEDAARETRVRGDYLRALEDEEFDVFGGDVYAKGFLSSYARYLQLDPQPLLDAYRRHVQHDDYDTAAIVAKPVARQPTKPPPTWLAWAVVLVVVIVGVALLAQVFGGRTPEPAAQRPPQPAVSATPDPTPEEPTTSPSPSPSPTFEGVNLVLAFDAESWMRVEIDGEAEYEGTPVAGDTLEFTGDETVTIRFGNPGGVRAELNGRDLGPQGEPGQPRTVTFTPDGPQAG